MNFSRTQKLRYEKTRQCCTYFGTNPTFKRLGVLQSRWLKQNHDFWVPLSLLKYTLRNAFKNTYALISAPRLRDPFLSDTINLVTQGMSKNPIRTDSFQLGPFMKTFQSFLLGIFSLKVNSDLFWIYNTKVNLS